MSIENKPKYANKISQNTLWGEEFMNINCKTHREWWQCQGLVKI